MVEDYIIHGFVKNPSGYLEYEGAIFTSLLQRMRSLPFGQKLQNHALNARLNEEFRKFFPHVDCQPIIRDLQTKRYWINDNLLKIKVFNKIYNIANVLIKIIDAYIDTKKAEFESFLKYTLELSQISENDISGATEFIKKQIQPNVDARVFEIITYAILKSYYFDIVVYWGYSSDELNSENLVLYKTGRTNANDGGIDFVMKPLGRFFQVTETLDFKKYFLDIDKIQRYPITFVVKTERSQEEIYSYLEKSALSYYGVKTIVQKYMNSVEEIINIPKIIKIFDDQVRKNRIKEIMDEIVIQSRLEFNYDD